MPDQLQGVRVPRREAGARSQRSPGNVAGSMAMAMVVDGIVGPMARKSIEVPGCSMSRTASRRGAAIPDRRSTPSARSVALRASPPRESASSMVFFDVRRRRSAAALALDSARKPIATRVVMSCLRPSAPHSSRSAARSLERLPLAGADARRPRISSAEGLVGCIRP
jgi:hypothetical protein